MTLPFSRVPDEDRAQLLATSPEEASAPCRPCLAVPRTTSPRLSQPASPAASPRPSSSSGSHSNDSRGSSSPRHRRVGRSTPLDVPAVVVDPGTPGTGTLGTGTPGTGTPCTGTPGTGTPGTGTAGTGTPGTEGGSALGTPLGADPDPQPCPGKRYPLQRRLRVTLSEEEAGVPLRELRGDLSRSCDPLRQEEDEVGWPRGMRWDTRRATSVNGNDSVPPSAGTRRKRFTATSASRSGECSITISRDDESLIRGPSRTEQVSPEAASCQRCQLRVLTTPHPAH